jgi:secreted PhoX family phosphatase
MTPDPSLTRRALLRSGALTAGALAFGPGFYRAAFAAAPATPGAGPYGALGAYDANGLALPSGFRSRLIARGGQVVPGTAYPWHVFTDGQAAFPTADGGWILVANSEVPSASGGGASSISFDRSGKVTGARRILAGTSMNCAGGPTPWGAWVSCEEHDAGMAWECDPTGATPAIPRPAMGTFAHESVCVDPLAERVYLTEDKPDGCFYRFIPDDYPDLSSGLLEVAKVDGAGRVTWAAVPNRNAVLPTPTRDQVAGAARFDGGEGSWWDSGVVFFTTKGDKKVWAYDTAASTLETVYDNDTAGDGSPLQSVDNVCVARSGDVYICEDGDNFEICLITPDRQVASFLRLDPVLHAGIDGLSNETVGVTFDPSGTRLYFGAQRSFGQGAVYEVTGPFRADAGAPAGIVVGGAATTLATTGEGRLTAADRVAPGVRLRHARSISAANLTRRGLALTLELTEPSALDVRLTGASGRTLARRRTPVAVRGRVRVRVKPGGATARTVRRRTRALRAQLVIVVRDAAGNRTTVRRKVTVRPARRRRRRR